MKRFLFALLLLPQLAYSQYKSDIFRPERSGVPSRYTIGTILREDTILTLDNRSEITVLSISGICVLSHDGDSYVRVTLMDDHNYEYLVYENYPLLSDELTTRFTDIAIETVMLDDITPKCLKVSMKDASLELESVNCHKAISTNRQSLSMKRPEEIQKKQVQYIVDRLNTNLRMRNMTWRAGMTSMAEKTFEEKKAMFGGELLFWRHIRYARCFGIHKKHRYKKCHDKHLCVGMGLEGQAWKRLDDRCERSRNMQFLLGIFSNSILGGVYQSVL